MLSSKAPGGRRLHRRRAGVGGAVFAEGGGGGGGLNELQAFIWKQPERYGTMFA